MKVHNEYLFQWPIEVALATTDAVVSKIDEIFEKEIVHLLTFCMYIRQTKVPTPIFATRLNFLYVCTHIMRVIIGQKNC